MNKLRDFFIQYINYIKNNCLKHLEHYKYKINLVNNFIMNWIIMLKKQDLN